MQVQKQEFATTYKQRIPYGAGKQVRKWQACSLLSDNIPKAHSINRRNGFQLLVDKFRPNLMVTIKERSGILFCTSVEMFVAL